MAVRNYKDIIAWQKADSLVIEIYSVTSAYPKIETFGLVSQMRRAAVSVPANIVEGFRRDKIKDSMRFYNIAEASLEELRYFLGLSVKLKYISESMGCTLEEQADEIARILYKWKKNHNRVY